ncbi:hypothetical protein [Endozoicomonas sp. OPT23]|uniref:hypothetical protein n=1 Tax=Endozoicomonas sp. OPT23 TaxID=2072845 RepID=UPI00129A98FB|nr:hypothetical protein [Endozoicomonas sp. OPT23]
MKLKLFFCLAILFSSNVYSVFLTANGIKDPKYIVYRDSDQNSERREELTFTFDDRGTTQYSVGEKTRSFTSIEASPVFHTFASQIHSNHPPAFFTIGFTAAMALIISQYYSVNSHQSPGQILNSFTLVSFSSQLGTYTLDITEEGSGFSASITITPGRGSQTSISINHQGEINYYTVVPARKEPNATDHLQSSPDQDSERKKQKTSPWNLFCCFQRGDNSVELEASTNFHGTYKALVNGYEWHLIASLTAVLFSTVYAQPNGYSSYFQ